MPAILSYRLEIARPSGVMRLAGMMLPGNGCPVSGSRIGVLISLKSPARILVVGSVRSVGVVKRSICFHSTPPKKNSLSLMIGPPSAPPKSLYLRSGLGTLRALLK